MKEDWLVQNNKKGGLASEQWQKTTRHVILSDSEESRAFMGQIINKSQLHFHYSAALLSLGILPRPKARLEWQRKRIDSWIMTNQDDYPNPILHSRCRDSSSLKSSFRMTKKKDWLVQNNKKGGLASEQWQKQPGMSFWAIAKNPAHSLNESCLKGDKIFTTQTFTHIAGILPRSKARSEWQWRRIG